MSDIQEKTTISPSKFTLCVFPTQLGKTFTAISRINKEIENDITHGKSIHVIFTMNTLLNSKQFATRLQSIEDTYGKGSVCVLASKPNGQYKTVKKVVELQGLYVNDATCPRVVIMCSNKKRFAEGRQFIEVVNASHVNVSRIFVYYDELHSYINLKLRKQIETIHEMENVTGILALTATPDKIWKKEGFWSNLNNVYINYFDDSDYAGFKDMQFHCIDDFFKETYVRPHPFDFALLNAQTVGFIKHVLDMHPEILDKNTRSFIPAHISQDGHNAVRELVFQRNPDAVVVLLNSKEKNMQYIETIDGVAKKKTISLVSRKEEVCETMARVIVEKKLQERPVVITGFHCVSMGQTMTHKTLGTFTSAIFSHMDLTNDCIYQLFGRVTGRVKGWGEKFVKTNIYCPTATMNRCHVMEECARNMVYSHTGEMISQDTYRDKIFQMGETGISVAKNIRIVKEKDDEEIERKKKEKEKEKEEKEAQKPEPIIQKFLDQKEVKIYYNTTLKEKMGGRGPSNRKPDEDGFYKATIGRNTGVKSVEEVYEKRKFSDKLDWPGYKLYPCYRDVTDKNTLEWWFIHY